MAQGIFTLKQVNQAIRQGAWSPFDSPKWVEYLVVAGGGGGAAQSGGGGGAGGLLTGIVPVTAGASYTVTVGGAGTGTAYNIGPATGGNGSNSVFSSITATGGGGGGADSSTSTPSGGSGGGAGMRTSVSGQGIAGQGNAGGSSKPDAVYASSGGGGAGTKGHNALYGGSAGTTGPGDGGTGIASAISGAVITYAGGGGGGVYVGTGNFSPSAGGAGGGGSGGATGGANINAVAGTTNTGGGGGGGGSSESTSYASGANGGSGIVIVRYPGTVQFYTGGTVNYANGYIVHTFYSNGTLAPTTPTQYSNTYQISRSLRFNAADTTNLSRTVSTSDRRTWTFSAWIKKSTEDTFQQIFSASAGATTFSAIRLQSQVLSLIAISGGSYENYIFGRISMADPSAWYHIVVVADTTSPVSTDRYKLYVNGNRLAVGAESTVTRNFETYFNFSSYTNYIGGLNYSGSQVSPFTGYMTEINFIDGQALTPSSFGEYDINTGVWEPRSYGGSYGTNGFKLNFSNNTNTTAATLGADSSGNGNNWTPNNFSVTAGVGNDSFVDTPTPYGTDTGAGGEVRGNYATWNSLQSPSSEHGGNGFHLANGNLQTGDGTDLYYSVYATILPKSGKFYMEKNYTNASSWSGLGLHRISNGSYAVISSYFTPYLLGGGDFSNNTSSNAFAWGYSISNTDTISMAVDYDNRAVWFAVNGVWIDGNGSQSSATVLAQIIAGDTSSAAFTWASGIDDIIIYSRDRYSTAHTNFGQRAYTYTAPSGFKAICTTNLPTPTIGATTATQANKFFAPITYTGNGTTNQQVSVGFQPDFVWNKCRSTGYAHYLEDTVRGANKPLRSASTQAETTETDAIMSFNTNGFIVGGNAATNYLNDTYVAWNWKAGGTAVTNTQGSITSTVSANPTSGFSIITYTGTGSAGATVGHGLGAVPSMIIFKKRSGTSDWQVYHTSLGNANSQYLNLTNSSASSPGMLNSTTPTSTLITLGTSTDTNPSAGTMVAYCFAPIAGYSAFGSYTGNGSTDGPFVHTGFRPAFILIQKTTGAGGYWLILDVARNTYNAMTAQLWPNGADAENNSYGVLDAVSNGFKLRNVTAGYNDSAAVYLYMAFASHPFKYSLAR